MVESKHSQKKTNPSLFVQEKNKGRASQVQKKKMGKMKRNTQNKFQLLPSDPLTTQMEVT